MTVRNPLYIGSTGHQVSMAVPASQAASGDELDLWKLSIRGDASFHGIQMNGNLIEGLKDPINLQDAATKSYVDNLQNGFSVKAPVRAATTPAIGNITLTGGAPNSLDGVTLAANDRVLVKDQTNAAQNGLYYISTLGTGSNGTWTRSTDADTSSEVKGGMYCFVNEGTANADSAWVLTTNDAIVLGTTSLTFTQFSGLGQILAGNGLTKTGNTINFVGGYGLEVNADYVALDLYTDGGLEFNGNKVKVKADTTQGISLGAGGVAVSLYPSTSGLQFNSGGLEAKLRSGYGLTKDANGIYIDLATNPGLQFSSNKLDLMLKASTGLAKDASGLYISLAANPGLQFTSGALDLFLRANYGLTKDANGLYIDLYATNPGLHFTSGKLALKLDASGGLQTGASGLGILLDPAVSGPGLSLGAGGLKASTGDGVYINPSGNLEVRLSTDSGLELAGAAGLRLKKGDGIGFDDTHGVFVDYGYGLSITTGQLVVVGVPTQFNIGASAVSTNVTAAALSALTGGSDVGSTYHSHSTVVSQMFTAGAAGVTQYDPIYISGSAVCLRGGSSGGTDDQGNVIGVALETRTSGQSVKVLSLGGTSGSPLSGLGFVAGDPVFLGATTGNRYVSYANIASGGRVVMMGFAISTTDLFVNIKDMGTKP